MTAILHLWATYLFVYVGMPLAWVSVFLHLRTPWRRTELGRHLLCYAVVIAAVMSFASARYWYGSAFPEWLEVCRFFVFALLIVVMGWRVALQVRAARGGRSV